MAELSPGHHLDDLLDRADAARQRHKGVGFLEHLVFALVHVVGDEQFVEPVKRSFGGLPVDEEARNDAGYLAAGLERAFGDRAHDAFGAAAVDQAQPDFGDAAPEQLSGLDIDFIAAGRRAAVDADGSNRVHATVW